MANYTESYHLYKQINDFPDDNYFNKKIQQILNNFPEETTELTKPTAAQIKTIFSYYLSDCSFTQRNWRSKLTVDKFLEEEGTDISATTSLPKATIKTVLLMLTEIFYKE